MYIGRPQKTGPYITLDDISSQFNGVDVTFNLTTGGSPFIADNPYTVFLSLNGVIQEPVSAFTIVGSQITFANPPLANANFFATVLGSTFNREIRNATSLASGVNITAGDISCNTLSSSGSVSATSFVGDGSQLSGIDATSLIDQNSTVRAQANPAGLVVTGILTATQFDGVDVTALRDSAGGNIIVQANPGGVVINGIATATTFVGNVTGNTSGTAGGLTGTPNITVGSVTAASGSFSGDVNIGGVLTYEDVTNIDSVGLITARSGIHVGTGVTFTEDLVVDGDARITGILTIGTGTVTIDGNNNSVNLGAGVTLHTITSSVNQFEVTGVSTFVGVGTFVNSLYVGDTLHAPNVIISGNTFGEDVDTRNINASGIITATNGFNLGISSTGTSITNGGAVTTLNFVGAGNSISYDSGTRTVDISISAGSDLVIVDGGDFNSSSSTAGANSEINGGEFT